MFWKYLAAVAENAEPAVGLPTYVEFQSCVDDAT
jgi:hypothetical protein